MKNHKSISAVFFLIVAVFISLGMARSIGIYRLVPMEVTILLLAAGALWSLFCIKGRTPNSRQICLFGVTASLLPYSLLTSRYPSLSILMIYFPLVSCVLYIVLAGSKDESPAEEAISLAALTGAKLGFIVCVSMHALTQLLFYIFSPVRTTGLMDDFSQASMLILCAYAMAYPMYRQRAFFSAFSLIFFVAFFVSFSRTANFLFIIFFIALTITAMKQNEGDNIVKLGILAILAMVFVYFYPNFVGETAVDRGGLTEFSTLNSRTIYWQTAWEAIQSRPLTGHGIGTYSYTGINEAEPYHTILYVHNDYLQIWHDLGIFWLLGFMGLYTYMMFNSPPIKLAKLQTSGKYWNVQIDNEMRFIAWILLASIAMYMGINFLINNLEFQVAIAIFAAELNRK